MTNPAPSAGGENQDRLARLRERAERDHPEAWTKPQPGEEISGELVRYERGRTDYGEKVIAILRLVDESERAVWLIHEVLLDEFRRQRPAPGEFILIRYVGVVQREGASGYHHYKLAVDREEAAPWDADGLEPAPAAVAPPPAPTPPSAPASPQPAAAPPPQPGVPHPSTGVHQPLDVPVGPPPAPPQAPTSSSSADDEIPF